MGAEIKRTDEQVDRKPDAGTGKGNSTAGNSTGAAGAVGTGGAAGAGGNSGPAAGTGKTAEAEKKPADLVVLEAPPAKPEPKKKPKKTRKAAAKKNDLVPAEQLDALLVTMSGIVAARPNCEHWAISQSEAHSITEPLCNILAKYEVVSKIGENADAIALATAAITVILPRAVMSYAMVKERKRIERTGNKTETNVKVAEAAASGETVQRKDERTPAGAVAENAIADLSDFDFAGLF